MTSLQFPPLWKAFDPAWYRQEYKTVLGDVISLSDADLKAWYEDQGAFSGHSPNRYFDEEWYRRNCSEALAEIAANRCRSGFEHYCRSGFKTQSPHYLFSERYYTSRSPDISLANLEKNGFANGYDHFLRSGDKEHRSWHLYFNPEIYIRNRPENPELAHLSPFIHLLHADKSMPDTVQLSSQFDPAWYRITHPEAVQAVEYGYTPNLLYQFLADFTPDGF